MQDSKAQERAKASITRERIMSSKSHTDRSTSTSSGKQPSGNAPYGQQRQPQRESENTDFDASDAEAPIDDPGDAQRSSKSEPDGDGEEEMR